MSNMTNVKIAQLVEYDEQPDHSYIVTVYKNDQTFTFACPQHVFEVLFTDNMFEPDGTQAEESLTAEEEVVESLPQHSRGDIGNQEGLNKESVGRVADHPESPNSGPEGEGSSELLVHPSGPDNESNGDSSDSTG